MRPTVASMSCRCHSGLLYASLTECPSCGHDSLDRLPGWEGCERRACGYQRSLEHESARIVAPHFVAGLEMTNGIVTRTAPILSYMNGWTRDRVGYYAKQKGWQATRRVVAA
jgi:hypothetical protein